MWLLLQTSGFWRNSAAEPWYMYTRPLPVSSLGALTAKSVNQKTSAVRWTVKLRPKTEVKNNLSFNLGIHLDWYPQYVPLLVQTWSPFSHIDTLVWFGSSAVLWLGWCKHTQLLLHLHPCLFWRTLEHPQQDHPTWSIADIDSLISCVVKV